MSNGNGRPLPVPKRVGEVSTYDVARAYLNAMHVTSWPRDSWQIREAKGQDKAAEWITELVDHINSIRNMVNNSMTMTVEEAAEDYRRMREGTHGNNR